MATKGELLKKNYFEQVGKRVALLRKNKKLTLEQLALEVGLNKADIFQIEKGKNITLLTVLKLSLAMGVEPKYFLDFKHGLKYDDLERLLK